MMITGDHQLTAKAIGSRPGHHRPGCPGDQRGRTGSHGQATLEAAVKTVNVYARVSPEHKLRIVQALQKDPKLWP
jgi:Ca2+-transporting ATPase